MNEFLDTIHGFHNHIRENVSWWITLLVIILLFLLKTPTIYMITVCAFLVALHTAKIADNTRKANKDEKDEKDGS